MRCTGSERLLIWLEAVRSPHPLIWNPFTGSTCSLVPAQDVVVLLLCKTLELMHWLQAMPRSLTQPRHLLLIRRSGPQCSWAR